MDNEVLNEAYERFRRTGPEWGEDQLTNHGPMAAEVLVRRGRAAQVHGWVDAYIRRLDELPAQSDPITEQDWRDALGNGQRIGDWTAFFERQVAEHPWREVLGTWWPRLLPSIVAGATHGVIRTGHAVRTLLAGDEDQTVRTELAHGLAFWAARALAVPHATAPAGRLDPAAALASIPRIPSQNGTVAARFGQLAELDRWPQAQAALRAGVDPDAARRRIADLVAAATVAYLGHGHASPVLLVHTATAPNAVLNTLPALPRELWAPSLAAAWAASAAITATYAPVVAGPTPASAPDSTDEALDRAAAHGDEHVIKFTDTAADVYERTGEADALAAAAQVAELIGSPR